MVSSPDQADRAIPHYFIQIHTPPESWAVPKHTAPKTGGISVAPVAMKKKAVRSRPFSSNNKPIIKKRALSEVGKCHPSETMMTRDSPGQALCRVFAWSKPSTIMTSC